MTNNLATYLIEPNYAEKEGKKKLEELGWDVLFPIYPPYQDVFSPPKTKMIGKIRWAFIFPIQISPHWILVYKLSNFANFASAVIVFLDSPLL